MVTAEVVASGIVRSGDDRVSVLVFVNRPTTNKQVKDPVVYKDQVTVTMQQVGDDLARRRPRHLTSRRMTGPRPRDASQGA